MANIEYANGHRPSGLLHLSDPALRTAPHPQQEDYSFDLHAALSSVLRLESHVPESASSSPTLATERQGNGVLISEDGLILAIGYLVVDADQIELRSRTGKEIRAELVGYNHESGLAIIRSIDELDVAPIPLGESENLVEKDNVILAPYGGPEHCIAGSVVSRREFAGSWEYMLNRAIFTAPIHPNWSGAALIGDDGTLKGIGSLWVNDAEQGRKESPGNMFVPIDLLKPIYDDLVTRGQVPGPTRPWLGMHTAEAMNRLFVSGVTPNGPAAEAGIEPGDLVVGINEMPVAILTEMYRVLWSLGDAGTELVLNLRRDGESLDLPITSDSRYSFMERRRQRH
jgi:S1-C subfamily serine protease